MNEAADILRKAKERADYLTLHSAVDRTCEGEHLRNECHRLLALASDDFPAWVLGTPFGRRDAFDRAIALAEAGE